MTSNVKRSFCILYTILAGIFGSSSIEASSSCKEVVQSLSSEEKLALDSFFRVLLRDSQGGYVLYGNKPICTEGVLELSGNVLVIDRDIHRRSIILKEGYRIWNSLLLTTPQSYKISMKETPNSWGWHELLLINREAFFKVVEENLLLFQYVLGPKVTPSSLWDKLMDPKETFSTIFRDDRVLTGIVLGFGTENALYGSRDELINEYLHGEDQQLPFNSISTRAQSKHRITDMGSIYNNLHGDPSFGYKSLKEEKDYLSKKLVISKEIVKKSNPMIPWFGCVKNQETQKLLQDYTDTQKTISTILEADQFLEQIFAKIFQGQTISIANRQNDISSDINFSALIGQELWLELLEQTDLWVNAFIEGMQESEQLATTLLPEESFYQLLVKLEDTKKALKAKQNLTTAEHFFASLQKRKDLVSVASGELYYHIIKEGSGRKISGTNAQVIMHCSVSNSSGDVLYATRENNVPLSGLISGITMGMIGMKTSEVREIFIHPLWAYGKESPTDPNMMLVARVEVTEILAEGTDTNTFSPQKLLLTSDSETELQHKTEELNREIAFQLGIKTWNYFKKNKSYSIDEVIASLRKAQRGEIIDLSSPDNQKALNKLHWGLVKP